MTPPALPNAPVRHMAQSLLPWESEKEFLALHEEWRAAYKPQGPAECALVDQLVWIDWRRRRLLLGERAVHMAQLHSRTSTQDGRGGSDAMVHRAVTHHAYRLRKFSSRTAISTTAADDADQAQFARDNLKRLKQALKILNAGAPKAYEEALCYLEEGGLEWWNEEREDELEKFPSNAEGLLKFLEFKLEPWLSDMGREADERPAVRLQAYGECLDPSRMDTLMGLDERLGRQFEKAMGMLLKLQELRSAKP